MFQTDMYFIQWENQIISNKGCFQEQKGKTLGTEHKSARKKDNVHPILHRCKKLFEMFHCIHVLYIQIFSGVVGWCDGAG